MALSAKKKLEKNARWLIVSYDSSLYYGWTLASFKSREAAEGEPGKLFTHIIRETPEQVVSRQTMPELPSECYFVLDPTRAWMAKDQLERMYQLMQTDQWIIDDGTFAYKLVVHFSPDQADGAAKYQRALHMLHAPYEIRDALPAGWLKPHQLSV